MIDIKKIGWIGIRLIIKGFVGTECFVNSYDLNIKKMKNIKKNFMNNIIFLPWKMWFSH